MNLSFIPLTAAAALLSFTTSPSARAACPPVLAGMSSPALASTRFPSLCAVYGASESAQARIRAHLGADASPLRLRALYGPRLVNFGPDYLGGLGTRAHGDPWWIYAPRYGEDPTPEVFGKWQNAEAEVEARAAADRAALQAGGAPAPIDARYLTSIHTRAFHGLPDWGLPLPPDIHDGYRQVSEEFGYYFRKDAVRPHTYDHLPAGQFHPLHCFDESPRDLTDREEAIVFPQGRRDAAGRPIAPVLKARVFRQLDQSPDFGFDAIEGGQTIRRQCGYFSFAPIEEIPAWVERSLAELNAATRDWSRPGASVDPLLLVARTQHSLMAIHPFNDGNGRTIRLLTDGLLRGLDLPAPIFWDTWNDLSYSDAAWAEQVAQGLERAVDLLEGCADTFEGKVPKRKFALGWADLCAPVPRAPGPRPW